MTVCRCVAGLPVCSTLDEAGMASISEKDNKASGELGCSWLGLSSGGEGHASISENDINESGELGGSRLGL
jgi:hypothetical protein